MEASGLAFLVLGTIGLIAWVTELWGRHISYERRTSIVNWFWTLFVCALILAAVHDLYTTGRINIPSFDYAGP